MSHRRRPHGAALLAACALVATVRDARAGHEDDRPRPPPHTIVLGDGPGAPRVEVRHDAGEGSFEVRVVPMGASEVVLVDPTVVVGGIRLPLARVEGKEQVWKVVNARLTASPLVATVEAKVDARTYSVPLGGEARVAPRAPSVRRRASAEADDGRRAPPARVGPEGGRLLPLGEGAVLAEVLHDPVAGRMTIVLRDRKDGSSVPIVMSGTPPPVAYLLTPTGAARVSFEAVRTRPDLSKVTRWERTARWTATSDHLKTPVVEGRLRVRVADAPLETNLGVIDVGMLDPPIEERLTLHGGRLVVFGDGAFHGEIVEDKVAGTLTMWLLEPKDKTPIPVADPPSAEVEHGGRIVVLPFEPLRILKNSGRADQWRATHAVLRDPGPLRGRVRVRVADRPYSAWLSPELGSRGGRLVRLGERLARVEVVRDREAGTVTLYVLDSPAPGTVFSEAPVLLMTTGEGQPLPVSFVPLEGRPGTFRLAHDGLRGTGTGRLRVRVGEQQFDEPLDPGNSTPAPGSAADQDAVPGDHDPGSRGPDRPAPAPAPPSDQDAIPGDSDPGSKTR